LLSQLPISASVPTTGRELITSTLEVVSSLMAREAGVGCGVGAGTAEDVEDEEEAPADCDADAPWLLLAALADCAGCTLGGFLVGVGVGLGFAFVAGAGVGLALAAAPDAPEAGGGLEALKLFQLTQPVMARAAVVKRRRDALVFMVGFLMSFTEQQVVS
jgi:hypothetical protein